MPKYVPQNFLLFSYLHELTLFLGFGNEMVIVPTMTKCLSLCLRKTRSAKRKVYVVEDFLVFLGRDRGVASDFADQLNFIFGQMEITMSRKRNLQLLV